MKKNFKRILSIVMILTMVFAMSATSFAGTNQVIDVTVEFIDENGSVYEVTTVSFDTNNFNGHLYTIPNNPGSAVITANTPTVMDASYKALQELGMNGGMITGWDTEGAGGMYITKMLGLETETAADTSPTVWRGYAWEYEIEYAESDLYATNVAATDGMTISWWYRYCEEPIV